MPPTSIKETNPFRKFVNSTMYSVLNPTLWPYFFVKKKVPFIAVEADKIKLFIENAKSGNLQTDKPIAEQKTHAKKVIQRLIRMSLWKSYAAIISHEYEHPNQLLRKKAMVYGMAFTMLGLSTYILHLINSETGAIPWLSALISGSAGRVVEEQISYDAEAKYYEKIMSCIKINKNIFEREVLGNDFSRSEV